MRSKPQGRRQRAKDRLSSGHLPLGLRNHVWADARGPVMEPAIVAALAGAPVAQDAPAARVGVQGVRASISRWTYGRSI